MGSTDEVKLYLKNVSASKPGHITLDEFCKKSRDFQRTFPSETARIANLLKNKSRCPSLLKRQINSAYPILHEKALPLFVNFIEWKKKHGTEVERSLYESIGLIEFVDRLLRKRPATFYGVEDRYLLFDETAGKGGFEKVGAVNEMPPLCLENLISYDEMKLSALLSVSSESSFVNNGDRALKGKPGTPGKFQAEGVIVGQVGSRFRKEGYMEWQDCIISETQNTAKNGYGNMENSMLIGIWSEFWQQKLPLWTDVNPEEYYYLEVSQGSSKQSQKQQGKGEKFGKIFFNVGVYKLRIQMVAEVLLSEAATKAKKFNCKAYVHVVGLGLGVWCITKKQHQLYVDAWGDALAVVDSEHIAIINFSWIEAESCNGTKNGEKYPKTAVTVYFSRRCIHDCVPGGTLLVCNYAWDSNSLPGNEFWLNKLGSTGDSAAACSSCIAELHNVHISPGVAGNNLHIATRTGVFHIEEYAQQVCGKSEMSSSQHPASNYDPFGNVENGEKSNFNLEAKNKHAGENRASELDSKECTDVHLSGITHTRLGPDDQTLCSHHMVLESDSKECTDVHLGGITHTRLGPDDQTLCSHHMVLESDDKEQCVVGTFQKRDSVTWSSEAGPLTKKKAENLGQNTKEFNTPAEKMKGKKKKKCKNGRKASSTQQEQKGFEIEEPESFKKNSKNAK